MAKPSVTPADLRACLCFRLRQATRQVTRFFDEELRETGLRATQVTLLGAVSMGGPITIRRLAEGLGLDRTTIGRNLQPLAREGLLVVEPGGDRRQRLVSITEAGSRRLTQALPAWARAHRRFTTELGNSDWPEVFDRLERFGR